MPEPSPDPHTDSKTPPNPDLTPMESFFDDLFNHHMVLPQPPEAPAPIDGVNDHDVPQKEDGSDPN